MKERDQAQHYNNKVIRAHTTNTSIMHTSLNSYAPIEGSMVQISSEKQLQQRQTTRDDDYYSVLGFQFQWPDALLMNMNIILQVSTDSFCHSGEVIDEAAVVGSRTLRTKAREFPEQGKLFVETRAQSLRTNSKVLHSQLSEGWDASIASLATIPTAVSDSWDYHAEIYHQQQRYQQQYQANALRVG